MTNPKHTDTSRSGDLVERLRGDWPEILVEKHWMMDSDAIDKQREEAADRIEALEAEVERLRRSAEYWKSICKIQTRETQSQQSKWTEALSRAALGETK